MGNTCYFIAVESFCLAKQSRVPPSMSYCTIGHFISPAGPAYLSVSLLLKAAFFHSTVFDLCAQDTVELSVLIAQYSTSKNQHTEVM